MESRLDPAPIAWGMTFGLVFSFLLWATALGGADSGILLELLRTPGFDKVVHVTVYGGATAVAIAALGDQRILRFVPAWPAMFFLISAADELRQRGIPGRDFSRDDMIANVIGVTLGWLIGRTLTSRRSKATMSAA